VCGENNEYSLTRFHGGKARGFTSPLLGMSHIATHTGVVNGEAQL